MNDWILFGCPLVPTSILGCNKDRIILPDIRPAGYPTSRISYNSIPDNCDDADNAVRYAQCCLRLQTGISKGEKKLIVEKVYRPHFRNKSQ